MRGCESKRKEKNSAIVLPLRLGFCVPHKPPFHAFGPTVLSVTPIYDYGVLFSKYYTFK